MSSPPDDEDVEASPPELLDPPEPPFDAPHAAARPRAGRRLTRDRIGEIEGTPIRPASHDTGIAGGPA
jgi:hypothetical protein